MQVSNSETNSNLPENSEKILSLALDLGKSMVQCGAEINRVEETVRHICSAYGIHKTQVFSVISMVYATVIEKNGKTNTQMRRIYSYAPNFDRLEQINALSRKICAERPPIEEAAAELKSIFVKKKKFRPTVCLGYIIAAMAFTVFFGGNFADSVASAPIALVIYLINAYVKSTGVNRLFFTALSSAAAGFLAIFFVHIGFGENANMIMIGDIMLIVPGLMIVNSVREMLCGDIMSGLLRLLESVMIALAIACGFAVAIITMGKIL
ncbi:MAG: threonine/serine exporter family protein [Clostridia bacterium]|nr:threonine/serine exporter family protein [Oscillospiraceae bacterium]MBQ7005400.1 threonine/serine exporter family protein [Clostridia bacterium]